MNDAAIADRMHLTLAEVRAMPNTDYMDMLAFYGLQAEREKHARTHAGAQRPTRRR